MTAINSNPEDIRKLHAEVTQLVNQRILLATLATTLVGAIIAWTIPRDVNHQYEFNGLPFVASITLFVVLSSLALLSHLLRRQLRVITIYLDVICESPWEGHWRLYRKDFKYPGYSKPISYHFIVLGLIAALFPYVLTPTELLTCAPRWLLYGPGGLFAIFSIGTYTLGASSGSQQDSICRQNWQAIKERHAKLIADVEA